MYDVLFEGRLRRKRRIILGKVVKGPAPGIRRRTIRKHAYEDIANARVRKQKHFHVTGDRVRVSAAEEWVTVGIDLDVAIRVVEDDRARRKGRAEHVERGAAHHELERAGRLKRLIGVPLVKRRTRRGIDRDHTDVCAPQRVGPIERRIDIRAKFRDVVARPRRTAERRRDDRWRGRDCDRSRAERGESEREDPGREASPRYASTRSAMRCATNAATSLGNVPRPKPAS